jgi:hypothetical protein
LIVFREELFDLNDLLIDSSNISISTNENVNVEKLISELNDRMIASRTNNIRTPSIRNSTMRIDDLLEMKLVQLVIFGDVSRYLYLIFNKYSKIISFFFYLDYFSKQNLQDW